MVNYFYCGAFSSQRGIPSFLQHLVGKGVLNVNEMRRHIREYLSNDFLWPTTTTNSQPPLFSIKKRCPKPHLPSNGTKCDQTNVSEKVKDWEKQCLKDMFFFHPHAGGQEDTEIHASEDEKDKDDEDYDEEVKARNSTSKQCPPNRLAKKIACKIWQLHLSVGPPDMHCHCSSLQ